MTTNNEHYPFSLLPDSSVWMASHGSEMPLFNYKWGWSSFLMFNGNLSKFVFELSVHILCLYLHFLFNCQSSLQIREISLLSYMLQIWHLIAITKRHTDWEFRWFFYMYRKQSFSFSLLHAQTKGDSEMRRGRLPVLPFDTGLMQIPPNSERWGNENHFR